MGRSLLSGLAKAWWKGWEMVDRPRKPLDAKQARVGKWTPAMTLMTPEK